MVLKSSEIHYDTEMSETYIGVCLVDFASSCVDPVLVTSPRHFRFGDTDINSLLAVFFIYSPLHHGPPYSVKE